MDSPQQRRQKYHSIEIENKTTSSFEERIKYIREKGKKAEEEFNIRYKEINDWFTADYDPLYLLSFCMRYLLMNDEGYDEEAETGGFAFAPHYLEILQALALSHSRVYSARPLWEDSERLVADMKQVGTLISGLLHKLPDNIKTAEDVYAYEVRMDVMSYSIAVRNWAYYYQMQKVAEDMAQLVQEEFIEVHGADPVEFVRLLFTMGHQIEVRVNEHMDKIRKALAHEDHVAVQEQYQRIFGDGHSEVDNPEKLWTFVGKDIKNLRGLLISHSDLRLPALFAFTLDEMMALSGGKLSKGALKGLMDQLSYSFGDLKDYPQDHMILDNPVHAKPFIKIEDEEYFTSLWTTVPHLILSILEGFVQNEDRLRNKYNLQRAKYLEDQVELLFRSSFPNAHIFRGSQYTGADGKMYENDLLIVLDSFAIVVEAKSGAVTKAAKRGAPDRLFKTLKELVDDPSEQALRFIEYLKINKGTNSFLTKGSANNIVDTSAVNYFIPLGVTFYHLGVIGTNLKLLVEGKITNKKIQELAPSICLTDLQIIFDVLSKEAMKVHYLHRRREFELQVKYSADELDLFGFYLETGFNIGDKDNEDNWVFNLSLQSKLLDPFFIAQHIRPSTARPTIIMTSWWKDILERLHSIRPPKWLEIAYVLLSLNEGDQEQLETCFKELVHRIKANQVELKHNWVAFRTAKKSRQYVVAVYPYLDRDRDERDSMLQEVLDTEYGENPLMKGAVTIGVNIDKAHYPYSILSGYLSISLFDDLFSNMSSNNPATPN